MIRSANERDHPAEADPPFHSTAARATLPIKQTNAHTEMTGPRAGGCPTHTLIRRFDGRIMDNLWAITLPGTRKTIQNTA